jgi:hypothetical protein
MKLMILAKIRVIRICFSSPPAASVLFIGEFAIYQVFTEMEDNLNFDAFYLIKYPD